MELIAKKQNAYGDWFKSWQLLDQTGKRYGTMDFNSHHANAQYKIYIGNHIHPELGSSAHSTFDRQEKALEWARERIQSLPKPTKEEILQAIERVKEIRYQDAMSDDYAYSNGKIARWDRVERELKNMLD